MEAWIIYSEADAIKNEHYIEMYIKEGKLLNIHFTLIFAEELQFGIQNGSWYIKLNGKTPNKPDFAICRIIYPLLSKQLEYLGIQVYNNSFVAQICNDKAKTYQYVATTGIDIIDTEFCKNEFISNKISCCNNKTVVKTVEGHGGKQVFLLLNDEANKITNQGNNKVSSEKFNQIREGIDKSDIVIQPLIGKMHQDLRVYVIGKSIIAAVLRTATEDFKSNFSLGGKVRLYELNDTESILVNKVIQLFDFGLVGIDFLIGDQGELIFNEIEDVVGSRMLYQCTDINIVRMYLNYILSK